MVVYIHTLGCPKNDADSATLAALIEHRGHEMVGDLSCADTVVINTCGFILDARQESIDALLAFSVGEKDRRQKVYGWGCLVQSGARELMETIPEVDGWLGVLPVEEVFDSLETGQSLVWYPQNPQPLHSLSCQKVYPGQRTAYLKIGDGCDRACGFCGIPSFKGMHRSRKMASIIDEARQLVADGIREIVLVDQDTTQYNDQGRGLSELLHAIHKIEGDFWIRVMYLHPDHLSQEMISLMIHLPKVLSYFDLPMQHGSDPILRRMNRIKNREQLLELVRSIRVMDADATIRSSMIIGCPGEEEEDFEALVDFVQQAQFDHLGCFIYSPEAGTPMAKDPPVSLSLARKRQERIMLLQEEISGGILERWIGKALDVLVEEETDHMYLGRSFRDAPDIDGMVWVKSERPIEVGEFVRCKVIQSMEHDLVGIAQ